MVKNEQGQIALVYYQPIPQTVRVNSFVYPFVIKNTISMAWVNEEHVPNILGITKSCCGGNTKNVFHYASDGQVRVWSGTGR